MVTVMVTKFTCNEVRGVLLLIIVMVVMVIILITMMMRRRMMMVTAITCNGVRGVLLLRGDIGGAIETWLDSVSSFSSNRTKGSSLIINLSSEKLLLVNRRQ